MEIPFELRSRRDHGAVIVDVAGDVDLATAPGVADAIDTVDEENGASS